MAASIARAATRTTTTARPTRVGGARRVLRGATPRRARGPRRVDASVSSAEEEEEADDARGRGDDGRDSLVASPRRPSRRATLASALGVFTGVAATGFSGPSSAGEVLDQLQNFLSDAEAAMEADPENEALVGQKNFFENQLERTQLNAQFVDRTRPRVRSGATNYAQRIVLEVDENLWEDEIYFWKNAMGMRVTRVDEVAEKKEEGGGKPKAAFLAFGQETLDADDGAKAGVEIRARGGGGNGAPGVVGTGLAYVSLSVPFGVRVSRIYEAGGELVYGFGYFDCKSPSGYRVRARVAARRDPLEYVAINVRDVQASERYYAKRYGMVSSAALDANPYAPKSPPGSRLLTFGEPRETLGILLQPAAASFDDVASELVLGDVYKGVVIVTGGEGGAKGIREGNERDEDGYGVEVVSYDAFERDVAAGARALPMEYNLPPVVKEE